VEGDTAVVPDCPFCERVADASRIISSNDGAVAFPDAFPVASGHVLVVPRRHLDRLERLELQEWSDVFGLVWDLCRGLSLVAGG
jgi:histidine triad (HIT) family protein